MKKEKASLFALDDFTLPVVTYLEEKEPAACLDLNPVRLQKLPVVIFVGPAAEDPSVPWAFSLSAALAFDFVAVAAKLFAVVNLAEFANF